MKGLATFCENGLISLICLLVVWAPIPLGSNRPWSSTLLAALVGILAVVWGLRLAFGSRVFHRPLQNAKLPVLLLLLVQTWVACQLYFGLSLNAGETFRSLILGLAYTLLFTMILDLFHTRARMNVLLVTLLASGAVQAFYGTIMVLSGIEWGALSEKEYYRGVATGTFVNRNHLAGYLEMTLACGIGFLLALRDGRPFSLRNFIALISGPKAITRLSLAIMVIGLVMTQSRMGNAAFFTSLLITGVLFVLSHKRNRLRNGLILLSLLLIDVLVLSQYFGLEKLQERIAGTKIETTVEGGGPHILADNEERDEVVRYSLPILQEYWRTGTGAGSFEVVFQQYTGPDITWHFDHAHNDFLEFGIEYGAIGFAPLAALVLLVLLRSVSTLMFDRSLYRTGIAFAGTMGIISLMTHSLVDFNLQIPANGLTFMVVLAIACGSRHLSIKREIPRFDSGVVVASTSSLRVTRL